MRDFAQISGDRYDRLSVIVSGLSNDGKRLLAVIRITLGGDNFFGGSRSGLQGKGIGDWGLGTGDWGLEKKEGERGREKGEGGKTEFIGEFDLVIFSG